MTVTTATAETVSAIVASRATENTSPRKWALICDIATAHSEITPNNTSDHAT